MYEFMIHSTRQKLHSQIISDLWDIFQDIMEKMMLRSSIF